VNPLLWLLLGNGDDHHLVLTDQQAGDLVVEVVILHRSRVKTAKNKNGEIRR
jgi:hypothetical protein